MTQESKELSGLIERAKELECLYRIDEALLKDSLDDIFMAVSEITPLGFQETQACIVTVEMGGKTYATRPTPSGCHVLRSDIFVANVHRGWIQAAYPPGGTAFLPQEQRLLDAISAKLARVIFQKEDKPERTKSWEPVLRLLQNTDKSMLLHICEKLLALLATKNQKLVDSIFSEMNWSDYDYQGEINYPLDHLPALDPIALSDRLFQVASGCFDHTQLLDYMMLWIYQRETYTLIKIINKRNSDVNDVAKALSQYLSAVKSNESISKATQRWLHVELIRRFLTGNPRLISTVRQYVTAEDFSALLSRLVCSPHSAGKIGGKAAGFFIANQIIRHRLAADPVFQNIRVPKTWYIPTDEMENLLYDSGLDELNEHKYRDLFEVRIFYPKIIQTLKNVKLSPYILNQLSQILDECEGTPLIIRSSSLLEDHMNAAFSGKYKSLFVANTGTKAQRLDSLVDGILEVYASLYNPDSIQYRRERNLLDSLEQMGIMIQEVVGCRVGPYYFPLYAGVAFSHNELRWSPRIRREDGLIRVVMGLGTRAVDRIGDDYPALISPGQPNLRVNQSMQEIRKYAPRMLDAIDMENNRFVSLSVTHVIREYGKEIPQLQQILSLVEEDFLKEPNLFFVDFKKDDFVVSFEGLISKTPVVAQIKTLLMLLRETLGYAVDIEFASDGEHFYILQCRPQSQGISQQPVAIPTDIAAQDVIFTANRYVSNGKVLGVKTVVYVDPEGYSNLRTHQELVSVASAVGALNELLPRRSFILMGPGRWGSRGDIKLGVPVTYSDISNTVMLIEIAHKRSGFQPELSFGTHFFQDLVESDIKYLPLYPDEGDNVFRRCFFTQSKNALRQLLPDYAFLEDVIKVIHVEDNYFGRELEILMNADLEKAVAYLALPAQVPQLSQLDEGSISREPPTNIAHSWKWRHYMAEQIAMQMDFEKYDVWGVYLFGSTNTCTARHNSDIDLLIHFKGDAQQKQQLDDWIRGWSEALAQINFLKTGYRLPGLLDVHYITDADIREKNCFAEKIHSPYDPALALRVRKQ